MEAHPPVSAESHGIRSKTLSSDLGAAESVLKHRQCPQSFHNFQPFASKLRARLHT